MIGLVFQAIMLFVMLVLQLGMLIVRWLPALLGVARYLVQLGLRLSFVVYQALLSRLSFVTTTVGVDLLTNPWRTGACIALSVAFGVMLLLLAGSEVSLPALGGLAAHGLLVGFIWDQLGPPNGLGLGM